MTNAVEYTKTGNVITPWRAVLVAVERGARVEVSQGYVGELWRLRKHMRVEFPRTAELYYTRQPCPNK